MRALRRTSALDALPAASPVARALHGGDAGDRVGRRGPRPDAARAGPGPARPPWRPATAVVLPLPAAGRTVGVLTLYLDAGTHASSDEDLETARQVAAEAGRAVARVHRQSQQAQLAEALQRSLLTDPPRARPRRDRGALRAGRRGRPRRRRLVRRLPAARTGRRCWSSATSSGTTPRPRRRWASCAALLRGIAHLQRRRPGRGAARPGRGHRRHAHRHPGHRGRRPARADAGRAERGVTRLRWANAGHPPPMVISPDGAVAVLGGPDRRPAARRRPHGRARGVGA